MWLIGLVVATIQILVSSPCDGVEISITVRSTKSPDPVAPAGTQATRIFARRANDDSMTYNVGDTSYVSLWDKIFYQLPNGESTEEQQSYTYNTYYNVPTTVNFHDIYSNSLALLAEDPVVTTAKEEEVSFTTVKEDKSFHLNSINTNFVEFHPKTQTIQSVTLPPPMTLVNSTSIKTDLEQTTTSTTSSTTEEQEPEEVSVEVIPIKKEDYQRGLLDLLFPAVRVRSFKTVFDTFRRIMSHTFR